MHFGQLPLQILLNRPNYDAALEYLPGNSEESTSSVEKYTASRRAAVGRRERAPHRGVGLQSADRAFAYRRIVGREADHRFRSECASASWFGQFFAVVSARSRIRDWRSGGAARPRYRILGWPSGGPVRQTLRAAGDEARLHFGSPVV